MPTHESDVCVIGSGVSAAMLAQELLELRPGISITIVEAGGKIFDFENRMKYRSRSIAYGENAWPGDFVHDQSAKGIISRTMAVGGSALHWGGTSNLFSQEDLRLKSMYGLATDWPVELTELEKFYCKAERRLGVSGEPDPFAQDERSEPYPMKPMTLSYNLLELKKWAEKSGFRSGEHRRQRIPNPTTAALSASAATPAQSVRPARDTHLISLTRSCSRRRKSPCTMEH